MSTTNTASSSGTETSYNPAQTGVVVPTTNSGSGVSSSLYLFTFLITILVLAVISASLLFRAYYVRRGYQRRVEEAIRTGEPLPQDAALALGLIEPAGRGKKTGPVGPSPGMWQAEMLLDRKAKDIGAEEMGWNGITPLSVLHFLPPIDPNAPQTLTLPPPRSRFFGLYRTQPLPRPSLDRLETSQSIHLDKPIPDELPPDGTEIAVGILIALPFEEGGEGDRWVTEDPEEEVAIPHVMLGVLKGSIDGSAQMTGSGEQDCQNVL